MDTNKHGSHLPEGELTHPIVGAMVVDRITDTERGQMLDDPGLCRLHDGPILNFKKPELEWERVVP